MICTNTNHHVNTLSTIKKEKKEKKKKKKKKSESEGSRFKPHKGARSGLGTQPHYEAPSDLRAELAQTQ